MPHFVEPSVGRNGWKTVDTEPGDIIERVRNVPPPTSLDTLHGIVSRAQRYLNAVRAAGSQYMVADSVVAEFERDITNGALKTAAITVNGHFTDLRREYLTSSLLSRPSHRNRARSGRSLTLP